MKELIKGKLNLLIGIYAIVFAIYSLIGRIMPIAKFITPINSAFYLMLAGGGALLVCLSMIFDRHILKAKYGKLLIAFILVTVFSAVLNRDYGYRSNMVNICWLIINIALFYTIYMRFEKENLLKWIRITFVVMMSRWIVAVVASSVQYVLQINYLYEVHGQIRRQGFMEGRLFGVFNDPNYAAVTSLYMVAASVWIIKTVNNKFIKTALALNICLNAVYVVLSGSRTALICAAFAIIMYALCYGKNVVLKKNLKTMTMVSAVLLTVVFSLLIFFGLNVSLKKILPKFVVSTEQTSEDEELPPANDALLERPDNTVENISNNRFNIWKGYLEALDGNEIFGLSPRNHMKYIKENSPDGYISQSGYETHNGYLTVYVATGIVGVAVVMLFLMCVIIEFIKIYFTKMELSQSFVFAVLVVGIILINAFFFTELFFVNNITTVLFYSLIGIAFEKKEEELV